MTIHKERRSGVLYLTLDTPDTAVNIFNVDTAVEMLMQMAAVNPAYTQAVVVRSAKPTSFINGVGLMLLNSAKEPEDVHAGGQLIRDAYAAVRQCPVPVIAAIQGMCWGCGVEFVLNTSHRIAADTYDTHFYMTELPHYLFAPVFRATRYLPETVGLERAINMVLWGERWGGRRAVEEALINECAPAADFDRAVDDFVDRVLAGQVASCLGAPDPAMRQRDIAQAPGIIADTKRRIAALPPAYQSVYTRTLDLLVAAATEDVGAEHAVREFDVGAETALAPPCKAASRFFFLRQMAWRKSRRFVPSVHDENAPLTLTVEDAGAGLTAWASELRQRFLPHVDVMGLPNDPKATASLPPKRLRLTELAPHKNPASNSPAGSQPSGDPGSSDAPVIVCRFDLDTRRPESDLVLWKLPNHEFIEISERQPGLLLERAPQLVAYLHRIGYQVAVTTSATELAGPRLVRAWMRALVRCMEQGADPATIDLALQNDGYMRRLPALCANLDLEQLSHMLARKTTTETAQTAADHQAIIDAVNVELLGEAILSRTAGYRHAVYIDLAARELLDYPLLHNSLCMRLTPAWAAAALDRLASRPELVCPQAEAHIRDWLAAGRPFYR